MFNIQYYMSCLKKTTHYITNNMSKSFFLHNRLYGPNKNKIPKKITESSYDHEIRGLKIF